MLKFVCERCKDEPAVIVQNCKNLRPVQIKDFSDDLSKIVKLPNASVTLFEAENQDAQQEQQDRDSKLQKAKSQPDAEPAAPVKSDEVFDLSTLVPDDFSEIPYAHQIATKKRAMEAFNSELSKIVDKQAQVKAKDYS